MESVKLVETRAGTSWETDHAACKASRVAVRYRGNSLKVHPSRINRSSLDMKSSGTGTNGVEQDGFGRRHPHLPLTLEPVEQGGAAVGIEMRRDLVEQQDRRFGASLGNELGMGPR